MPTVSINAPKTLVTKGSNGIASATLPNICKMPGPPAPFVPTPLPNIGMSGRQPSGYSTSVKIDGNPVAIQGSSFGSQGDVASQGTGGGLISSNVEGPTTFLGPGSLNVRIESKNVQFLGDPMLNNCGPSGSPPNAATMAGVMQPSLEADAIRAKIPAETLIVCNVLCECLSVGLKQNCVSAALQAADVAGTSNIKPEVPFDMRTSPPTPTTYPGQRRPYAVVVFDPSKPATRDNLKAVIEVKIYPGDRWRMGQKEAYERIAGDPDKAVEINNRNCQCTDDKPPPPVVLPAPAPDTEKEKEQAPDATQSDNGWVKPVAGVVAVVAVVGVAILLAPEIAAAAAATATALAAAAAATAVFSLFSSPNTDDGGSA
jgi:Domain of unknown function (DUF4150)